MRLDFRPPRKIRDFTPDFHEMCFYQYLPVRMTDAELLPGDLHTRIPERLRAFRPMIDSAYHAFLAITGQNWTQDHYIYLTVTRGWATTDNPLNRPGWHIDAWGHPEDHNYVRVYQYPTYYV